MRRRGGGGAGWEREVTVVQESAELDVRAVVVLGCGGGGGSVRLGRELNATAVVTLGRGGGGGPCG